MAATLVSGSGGSMCSWSMSVDDEGHRTYKAKFKVQHLHTDGPFTVWNCPGLPASGSTWEFGSETDEWAFCLATMSVTPTVTDGQNHVSVVEKTFSTKPVDPSKQRCQDNPVGDPLLEPYKISGKFTKYTEEATKDRFGLPVVNSAFEQIRGPQAEFDANRSSIKIEMNVFPLPDALFMPMIDCVNDAPLWGLPARCWKLGPPTWERAFYGTCSIYFKLTYEFESNTKVDPITGATVSGFDRDVLDEGTKMLNGHWDGPTGNYVLDPIQGDPPNPANPQHFVRAMGRDGNPCKVPLNGGGIPVGVQVNPGAITTIIAEGSVFAPTTILLISAQPPTPSKLTFTYRQPSGGIASDHFSATLTIFGLDDRGTPTIEVFPMFSQGGASDVHVTLNKYSSVQSVLMQEVTLVVDFGGGTVKATSQGDPLTTAAYTHIEKYNYANFLLLNIPVNFNIP